jgi:hypothetical protein
VLKIENLNERGFYKVIQIIIYGVPKIFFAKEEPKYFHRDFLKDILENNRLSYLSVKVFDDRGPSLLGEKYAVMGMGGARLLANKHILLFGHSFDYSLDISKEHTERLRQEEYPDWEFTVSHTPVGETL